MLEGQRKSNTTKIIWICLFSCLLVASVGLNRQTNRIMVRPSPHIYICIDPYTSLYIYIYIHTYVYIYICTVEILSFMVRSSSHCKTGWKSASERVSERTSENLWKSLKNLWKTSNSSETLPLRDPLRDRFPSQRLSVLLPKFLLNS